jgi:ABC-type Fe3+ transport system permease subunit
MDRTVRCCAAAVLCCSCAILCAERQHSKGQIHPPQAAEIAARQPPSTERRKVLNTDWAVLCSMLVVLHTAGSRDSSILGPWKPQHIRTLELSSFEAHSFIHSFIHSSTHRRQP